MGYIGIDRANDDEEYWCKTAPTAEQEKQEDVVTTHDVSCGPDGIPRMSGSKGE